MTEIGRDLPTTPQPQPSWRQQQHQGAPKLPGALPGLAISSADPGIGPELHHTPTPSGAPWKLWKSSSTYSDTSCSTAQRDASSSAPFLDFLSLPQVHLSSFNPLQLLSRPANGGPLSASSSSRQETPRPLDGSTLGAPFEESTGAQKYTSKPALEEQNLKLDEGNAGTVTVKDQSSEQASPLLLQDRPRLSLGTRISRRTSQSPASPQFKQAEHATSLDPITFHSIARASSEGEALKAVSQRQLRESNRNLGSMERPPPEQPQSARNSNPNSNPYASTYARIPVDGHQTDKPYGQLVDSPERLSLASSSPEQEQRTLEAAVANLDIADAEEAPTEATELGSEAKAAKRSLFSRLRFSRSVSSASSSATPIASPQRSRLPSYSYANSSRMAPNPSSHSRVVSAAAQTLDTPNNNTDSKPSKRLSISSVSTHDSDALSTAAQQTPFKTPPRPKVHRIKTKVKHKEVREFGHLFLAQELRLDPPKSPHSLESKVSPSVDTASFSNPLDSATSLPLSSTHPSVDNFQSPPVTSTASVNGRKKQAVWAMEFSQDGQYLAAAGHDAVVRVWKVLSSDSQPHPRPGSEQECLADDAPLASAKSNKSKTPKTQRAQAPVFESAPLKEFVGHTGDVLDLSWSKNNFILSSSMDKTVRLWHVSRPDCLCIFEHSDFVTSVVFHPRDDRFFLSGSLDCRLRLWSVPSKCLHAWTELNQLITSVAFSSDGKTAMSGSFSGQIAFFDTETLTQQSMLEAKSNRGKNQGKKVTHLESVPSSTDKSDHLLVTTNDSRLRLYNTQDRTLDSKFSGHENNSSQIRASFSDDGRFIVCGSEDGQVYIWDSGIGKDDVGISWMNRKKPTAGCEMFSAESNITTCALMAPAKTKAILQQSGDVLLNGGEAPMPRPRSRSIAGWRLSRTGSQASQASETQPQQLPIPTRGRTETIEDALIVTSDDSSGLIRVYRNSPFMNGSQTPSRMVPSSSACSLTPSKRGSKQLSPLPSPQLS